MRLNSNKLSASNLAIQYPGNTTQQTSVKGSKFPKLLLKDWFTFFSSLSSNIRTLKRGSSLLSPITGSLGVFYLIVLSCSYNIIINVA